MLFLSAAMPLPERLPMFKYSPPAFVHRHADLRQVIEVLTSPFRPSRPHSIKGKSPMGSPGSPSALHGQYQHQQTSQPEFPWQYRMRVTPSAARKRMERTASNGRRNSKEPSVINARLAEKRAAVEKGAKEQVRPLQEARAREERLRARQDVARANAQKVDEAGREAAAAAAAGTIAGVSLLLTQRSERLDMRDELLDKARALSKDDVNHLRFRLGEAIIASRKTTDQLIREWDKNGDGNLSKIEFKQAIRLTLALTASNVEIDSVFDSFDESGDGSLELSELRPAIHRVFEHVRTVKAAQTRLRAEAEECEQLVVQLDACLTMAESWDELRAKLEKLRSVPPLETRLGLSLETPTQGFDRSSCAELAKAWSNDSRGFLSKDNMHREILRLKNRGDLRIDGSSTEVSA